MQKTRSGAIPTVMYPELWLIRGKIPVLWTIPFKVVWNGDKASLLYAVPLSGRQIREIAKVMDQHGKQVEFGKWVMGRATLERLGTPLPPGTDPDVVFSWHLPHPSEKPENQREETTAVNEFVSDLYQKGVGKNREEVYYWWTQFCNHMADTLLNQEKPVDLMFVKLHLSPYRRNWLFTVISRLPRLGRMLCPSKGKERETVANRGGLVDELLSLDLLAMNKKEGWCYRYVEVEHTAKWYRTVRTVERARLAVLGAQKYATYVVGQVRRRLKVSIQLYALWLCDIARPSVTHVECGDSGEYRLAPHAPPSKVPLTGYRTYYVPVVVANKLPTFKEARPLEYLYEKDIALHSVPPVQPETIDLRDGGGQLLQPTDPQTGTTGMLVPPPGESRLAV